MAPQPNAIMWLVIKNQAISDISHQLPLGLPSHPSPKVRRRQARLPRRRNPQKPGEILDTRRSAEPIRPPGQQLGISPQILDAAVGRGDVHLAVRHVAVDFLDKCGSVRPVCIPTCRLDNPISPGFPRFLAVAALVHDPPAARAQFVRRWPKLAAGPAVWPILDRLDHDGIGKLAEVSQIAFKHQFVIISLTCASRCQLPEQVQALRDQAVR